MTTTVYNDLFFDRQVDDALASARALSVWAGEELAFYRVSARIGERARQILEQNPASSLRAVSAAAGVSTGTVRDVRDRLRERTETPTEAAARRGR